MKKIIAYAIAITIWLAVGFYAATNYKIVITKSDMRINPTTTWTISLDRR